MSRRFRTPSRERWDFKRDSPAPKVQEQQQEQEEQKQHQGRETAGAPLPASSGGGGGGEGGGGEYPFGSYQNASDSSSSSSSSSLQRSEPTNQQDQEQQQEHEEEEQERTTPASLLASPRGAGDMTPTIVNTAENEEEGEEEVEEEESHVSSFSSMSSLSSSSSMHSLTALPDEVEEEEEEKDEEEELAALQEAMKKSLEDDLDRHLAEVQAEREAAAKALKEERRKFVQLLKIKELMEGDTDTLSSLFCGVRYLYTLLSSLICMLTEDILHVCLPALLSFCLSLFRLLKRGAWREVGPVVETKLHRLSSHLLLLPSDLTQLLSKFPFLPSTALMGMGLLLGCGVWYWRLKVEMEYTAAAAASAAAAAEAAARSEKMEDVGEGLEDALVGVFAYTKKLVSG